MTFCVGMNLKQGLVGLSDTLIITGNESINARKITIHNSGNSPFFLMTSGLRSVRDKALTYFDEYLMETDEKYDKLYKAVNAFAEQLRRVRKEDNEGLEETGLNFNLYSIFGGQLENDEEPKLFLLYPQGNWVEVGIRSPYTIIGESKFGKPIIGRTLTYDTDLETALKIAYLAFDSTRANAINVDFPIDIVIMKHNSFHIEEYRLTMRDMLDISKWWQDSLRKSVQDLPSEWITELLNDNKLKEVK